MKNPFEITEELVEDLAKTNFETVEIYICELIGARRKSWNNVEPHIAECYRKGMRNTLKLLQKKLDKNLEDKDTIYKSLDHINERLKAIELKFNLRKKAKNKDFLHVQGIRFDDELDYIRVTISDIGNIVSVSALSLDEVVKLHSWLSKFLEERLEE